MSQTVLEYFHNDELATSVWLSKYKFANEKTPADMFKRHIKEIAEIQKEQIEKNYQKIKDNLDKLSEEGKQYFGDLIFAYDELPKEEFLEYIENCLTPYINFEASVFGGSMLQGIGNHALYSSLSNCFVVGQPYDSYSGINKKSDEIVQLMKRRGGAGVDLSTLRPSGSKIHNQASFSDGPVLFAEGYSHKTIEVAQNGRRGALMISLDIRHPDSPKFITSKQDLTKITGANISVKIPDDFMFAVENDTDYVLRFPVIDELPFNSTYIDSLPYNELVTIPLPYDGTDKSEFIPKYVKKIKAKELWETLIQCAWKTAEPGILFTGNWKKFGPDYAYEQYRPISTNPCFEYKTPLLTKNGYFKIGEKVGEKVTIWNGIEWSEVEPKITAENQEMLKITLSNGSVFRCTKYHSWPIWHGFSREGFEVSTEAQYLKVGDKISKFKLPVIEFGEDLKTEKFMYSQGFYCGDGTTSRNSARLYAEKMKLSEFLLGNISDSGIKTNHYNTEYVNFIFSENMMDKYFVPNNYSIKTRLAWLSGYIDADGTIDECGACQITSTNPEVINNIRLMLETLGIQANINNAHSEGIHSLPDQKGGRVDVLCKATKRILIRGLDVQKLLKMGLKTHRCDFTKYNPIRDTARFITIKSIVPDGIDEKVYCFNEPKRHKAIFNGILLGQCSEIPMQPYDACRLLAYNLYSLVENPFTKHSKFNFRKARNGFYKQLIIADLLVSLELQYIDRIIDKINSGNDPEELKQSEIEIWVKIKETASKGRRCGCGFTGFGDMLAALNLNYNNSELTTNLTRDIFSDKYCWELKASVDLSILFGTFDGFDADKELKSDYYNEAVRYYPQKILNEVNRMLKYGRRNISWSTAAPTGSLSILTQTTSGIEPLFKPYYKRRKKCILESDRVDYIDSNDGQKFTEYFVMHPKFIEWFTINNTHAIIEHNENIIACKKYLELLSESELNQIFEKSPWFGSCANDIKWEDRVKIQSIVQFYTTHAISSTINLPEDISPEIIGKIYFKSWVEGLKGNTVYREGSRGGIIVSVDDKNYKEYQKSLIKEADTKRPISLPAHYYNFKSSKKNYSIIFGFMNNKIYEVFIVSELDNFPKTLEFNEHIVGKIVRDTSDWYNFVTDTFILRELTDMQHDEKLLSLMLSCLFRNETPVEQVIKVLDKSKPIAGTFTHKLIKIMSKYATSFEKGEKCSECGSELTHENGCVICKSCGHTKC